MLPLTLAAAVGTYFLLTRLGVGADWAVVLAAIVGGWTQGRLTRH